MIIKNRNKNKSEVIVYHLKGHVSGIQEHVDETLGDKIIGKEDSIEKLIAYLDSIYAKDDITHAWMKYKKFVERKRGNNQPMKKFVVGY